MSRYFSSLLKRNVCLGKYAVRLQSSLNRFTERSHTCGELTRDHVGQKVNLLGWVQYTRFSNKLITLKDSYGSIQCVVSQEQLAKEFKKISIHNESVAKILGTVKLRPEGQRNSRMPTGEIEILAESVDILSSAKKELPILDRDELNPVTSINRLKFRYLDLRKHEMQHALRFRSQVCKIIRDKLHDLRFVECETPTLFNRTPGGAHEFVVPTQIPDKFYSLTQSPQQLKQLLMIGGLDRYFQICRCYRDETGRPDRQPEFTQIDIELSFTNQNLVMGLIEELIHHLMSDIFIEREPISSFAGSNCLRRISYQRAFEKYGTDKPDMRFKWDIRPNESGGLFIEIPRQLDAIKILESIQIAQEYVKMDDTDTLSATHTEHATIVESSSTSDQARKALGRLRIMIAEELENQGVQVYDKAYDFLWVTDFPLFTRDERGNLESNHHPFTAPTADTAHLLDTNPTSVIGQHYDLVLNGQEIAGGSMRIHDVGLQRRIFEMLGCKSDTFDYFLEALDSGCPPHGGIAIGLDRLVAILLNRDSIKDVIAFPKSSSGRDLMTDCPQSITEDVKKLYHLKPA